MSEALIYSVLKKEVYNNNIWRIHERTIPVWKKQRIALEEGTDKDHIF